MNTRRLGSIPLCRFVHWAAPPRHVRPIAFAGDHGFYGMARSSFRRRKVAGGSEGGKGMDIAVLGVDLGKNVCSVVGLDGSGAVVMRRRVRRETLIALAEKLPPCVVGMEACCGAHHLGSLFVAHGHDVRLMSPEYVRPYVKAPCQRIYRASSRSSTSRIRPAPAAKARCTGSARTSGKGSTSFPRSSE